MITVEGTKKYLGTQKLTPLQLLWTVVGIFFFIFMDTDIFQDFSNITKIVIYAGFMVVCILLGVSVINVKKIAGDLKAIYLNKSMTAEQKVNAYGNLALTVLSQLGEAWELLNEEQFPAKKEEVKEPIETIES